MALNDREALRSVDVAYGEHRTYAAEARRPHAARMTQSGHLVRSRSQAFTTAPYKYGLARKALPGTQRPRSIDFPEV
jgi:hypothetical protein